MVSPVERVWAKQWMKIRAEYLEGKLADFALHPAADDPDQYYWDCHECEAVGQATLSWAKAELAATGHVSSHVSEEDWEILEDMKVTMMPAELLTRHQRARKRVIEERRH